MRLGRWELGWSRNVAIGVIWTRDGQIGVLLLGMMLARDWPFVGKAGGR